MDRYTLTPDLSISRIITGLWQIADLEKDGQELDPVQTAKHMQQYKIKNMNRISITMLTLVCIFCVGNTNAQTTRTFKDERDGKIYRKVKIGSQVWMVENLAYKPTKGGWAYEDDANSSKYGHLYNFETAKTVCPNGWHLPTKSEFETLFNNYGGNITDKDSDEFVQASYAALVTGGESSFSANFGGWHCNGSYGFMGLFGYYWSSSDFEDDTIAWNFLIHSGLKESYMGLNMKSVGACVRCIEDN